MKIGTQTSESDVGIYLALFIYTKKKQISILYLKRKKAEWSIEIP